MAAGKGRGWRPWSTRPAGNPAKAGKRGDKGDDIATGIEAEAARENAEDNAAPPVAMAPQEEEPQAVPAAPNEEGTLIGNTVRRLWYGEQIDPLKWAELQKIRKPVAARIANDMEQAGQTLRVMRKNGTLDRVLDWHVKYINPETGIPRRIDLSRTLRKATRLPIEKVPVDADGNRITREQGLLEQLNEIRAAYSKLRVAMLADRFMNEIYSHEGENIELTDEWGLETDRQIREHILKEYFGVTTRLPPVPINQMSSRRAFITGATAAATVGISRLVTETKQLHPVPLGMAGAIVGYIGEWAASEAVYRNYLAEMRRMAAFTPAANDAYLRFSRFTERLAAAEAQEFEAVFNELVAQRQTTAAPAVTQPPVQDRAKDSAASASHRPTASAPAKGSVPIVPRQKPPTESPDTRGPWGGVQSETYAGVEPDALDDSVEAQNREQLKAAVEKMLAAYIGVFNKLVEERHPFYKRLLNYSDAFDNPPAEQNAPASKAKPRTRIHAGAMSENAHTFYLEVRELVKETYYYKLMFHYLSQDPPGKLDFNEAFQKKMKNDFLKKYLQVGNWELIDEMRRVALKAGVFGMMADIPALSDELYEKFFKKEEKAEPRPAKEGQSKHEKSPEHEQQPAPKGNRQYRPRAGFFTILAAAAGMVIGGYDYETRAEAVKRLDPLFPEGFKKFHTTATKLAEQGADDIMREVQNELKQLQHQQAEAERRRKNTPLMWPWQR